MKESYVITKVKSSSEEENRARLDLVYEVNKRVRSMSRVTRMTQLLEQTILMTQRTLNAAAASIMLFNDNHELVFEVASGPVAKALKRVKIDLKSSIAGHVATTGEPLIVNDVKRDQRFQKAVDSTTGFVTKSLICAPMATHRDIIGVIEVLNKLDGGDFTEQDLETVLSVATTAAMAIENTKLHQTVVEAYRNTIMALAAAIDAKDPYTRGHSQRVMEYTLLAGTYLLLPAEEMETLEYTSILHDIGKIAIDASILNKPGALTPSERNIVREHPVIGAALLDEIPFLEKSSDLVLYHHERYDGKGYPSGIKGEDIPLGARLITVADAFDTMTTDRSYRPARSIEQAITELYACSEKQFCPLAVEAFVSSFRGQSKKQ